MRTSLLAYTLLAFVPGVFPAPLFGLGGNKGATTSPVSNATVSSDLVRPAQFARLAYCSAGAVQSFNCGGPCTDLGGNVKVTQVGGGARSLSLSRAYPFFYSLCADNGAIPMCKQPLSFPLPHLIAFQTSSQQMLIRIKLSLPIRAQIFRTCVTLRLSDTTSLILSCQHVCSQRR
jgi:hypothetical protein